MRIFVMAKTVTMNLLRGPATLMYPKRKRVYTKITRGRIENEIGKCIFCGQCEDVCPTGAIKLTNYYKMSTRDKLEVHGEGDGLEK